MKLTGTKKVVTDGDGFPWLVVGVGDDGQYEAWKLEVVERHLFDRSWQAVQYVAGQHANPSAGTARALPSPADAPDHTVDVGRLVVPASDLSEVSEFDEPHRFYGGAA